MIQTPGEGRRFGFGDGVSLLSGGFHCSGLVTVPTALLWHVAGLTTAPSMID
jgi:hypothetical protein